MSRNNNSGIGAFGLATGLGLLAGLGYAAYELYNEYEQQQQRQQQQRLLAIEDRPSNPKKCFLCDDKFDESLLYKLECDHKFHFLCLAADFVKEKGENPNIDYKCPTCSLTVSKFDINAFTRDYQH